MEESVVVSVQQMGFDLLRGIQSYSDHDEERRAAEIKWHVQFIDQKLRNHTHDGQLNRTGEGNFRKDGVDVIRGSLSGPNTRDETTIFF